MKKRLAITGLLVTLALGGIIGTHLWINSTGHNVKIDETTLSGNLDAAKGWQVTTRVQTTGTPTGGSEGKIYYHNFDMGWETAATIQDSVKVKSKNIRGEDFSQESHLFDMDFLLTSGGSHWETNLLNEISSHFKIPMPLLQEIADKIGPGESIEETVNLKQYMDTVRATCSMESYSPTNGEDLAFMTGSEYDFVKQFVVEVPENYPVTITLAKDEDGAVKSFHYVTLTETSDSFASLVTDDYLYVAINGYREDDTGEFHGLKLKRVSGILQLPLTDTKEIDVEHMQKVYDIPAGIFIEKLSISEDGSNLLLITTEEETTYLSVIDKETMTLEQKVALNFDPLDKHETVFKTYIHENSVTAVTDMGRYITLILKDGYYVEFAQGKIFKEEDFDGFSYISLANCVAAVSSDEKTMAIAALLYNENDEITPSYYMEVRDKDQLLYAGIFENSLTGDLEVRDVRDYHIDIDFVQ